jgi:hypothetical protein
MSTAQETKPTESKPQPPDALVNPASQAFMNQMVAAAVREAIQGMLPLIKEVALTPEKIAEAERIRRAPDPAVVEREQRESKLMHLELQEQREQKAATQKACRHRHPNGKLAVSPVRNFPDRQVRFVCSKCQDWIHPKQWQVAAPDRDNPRGNPYIADAHPLYAEIFSAYQTENPDTIA